MTNKGGACPSKQVTRGFDNSDIPNSVTREVRKLEAAAAEMHRRSKMKKNCKPIIVPASDATRARHAKNLRKAQSRANNL